METTLKDQLSKIEFADARESFMSWSWLENNQEKTHGEFVEEKRQLLLAKFLVQDEIRNKAIQRSNPSYQRRLGSQVFLRILKDKIEIVLWSKGSETIIFSRKNVSAYLNRFRFLVSTYDRVSF